MENFIKKLTGKGVLLTSVNMLALLAVIQNVNVACSWMAYQPEVPEAAKKFMHE